MKAEQLKNIIKQAVREAVREEIKDILTEAVSSASQPIKQPAPKPVQKQTPKSGDPIMEMLNMTQQSMTRDDFKNIMSQTCLLYTSPSPRDRTRSRMPSSA